MLASNVYIYYLAFYESCIWNDTNSQKWWLSEAHLKVTDKNNVIKRLYLNNFGHAFKKKMIEINVFMTTSIY